MKRLLLYFSYIGTNYRGLQTTLRKTSTAPDLESVQGILEFGLGKVLRIPKGVRIFTSSRTDVGVHACESTAVFDLDEKSPKYDKNPYSPECLCHDLNFFLEKNECDIRIRRIVEVPNGFNPRRAYSRVYEFRVAVLNDFPHNVFSSVLVSAGANIQELNRCEVISQPFDVRSTQDACSLFLGQWDFSTFMKSAGDEVPADKRVKTIRRFSLTPEVIPESSWDSVSSDLSCQPYDIYKFTVEGSGFLRRQVRRMVGSLVGIGRGVISTNDILWMLKNPREQNWPSQISALGPNGLYLKRINYASADILRGYLSSN